MKREVGHRLAVSYELKRYEKEIERKLSNKDLERISSFSSDPFSSRKASWKGKKELEQSSFDSKDGAYLELDLRIQSAMREEG